jgi:hypothetical protein
MKCIKAIRSTKNTEVGEIKRINDIEAESSVKSGYWKYVPKSEYKGPKAIKEEAIAVVEETKKVNKQNKK